MGRDDEPRHAAVRRRPCPSGGELRDRQRGARRTALTAAVRAGGIRAGSGEVGTHIAPDTFEGLLLRAFDPYPYDPAAAREEMRDAPLRSDPRRPCAMRRCAATSERSSSMSASIPDQARLIRKDLAEVGIDLALEIRPIDPFFRNDPRSSRAGPDRDRLRVGEGLSGRRRVVPGSVRRHRAGIWDEHLARRGQPGAAPRVGVRGHEGPKHRRSPRSVPATPRGGTGSSAGPSWTSTS